TWRNLLYETSEDTELSKIQRMKGSSTNISTPLMRCRMETQPGAGSRYFGRSVKALMLRNSGRFLASSVMGSFFRCRGGRCGQPKILLQCNRLLPKTDVRACARTPVRPQFNSLR